MGDKRVPGLIQAGLFVGNRSGHNPGANWAKARGRNRVQQVLTAEATPKGVAAHGLQAANRATDSGLQKWSAMECNPWLRLERRVCSATRMDQGPTQGQQTATDRTRLELIMALE